MTKTTGRVLAVVLLVALALAFLLTMRAGHDWGDDFALYLHHARNLAEGKPYASVGLIDNPNVPHLGPLFYPPGFPWMLAPAVRIYGLNFTLLKAEMVLTFVLGLLFCFLLFEERLPPAWTLSAIALIGANPVFWKRSTEVLADYPFLMVAYGGLWLIHAVYRRTKDQPPLWMAVPFGAAIYLAYAVKPHGIAVAGAFAIYELLRARRIRPILPVTACVAAAGAVAQLMLVGRDSRYTLFNFSPKWLACSVAGNVKGYREWWLTGYVPASSYILFAAVVALTALGIWRSRRAGIRVYDLFALLYMLVVIAYPVVVERYLIPVVPVLMLYLVIGLRDFTEAMPAAGARAVLAGAAAAAVFSYGTIYAKADRGPIREGIFDPDFAALCRYIKTRTPPGSRIVFRKPRLLTLVTDRPAAVYHEPADRAELWAFLHSIGASYVIVADLPQEEMASDRTYLRPFVSTYRDRLLSVYRNPHYELFRICTP